MISSVRGVLANLLNFRLSLSFGRKKRRGSGSNDRENETFFVHLISFSSHQLVAREQATLHARVQATRSRLRCVVIAHVPFFNDFCEFPKIATHAVARSRARDIGDSANDRLGNFDSVFTHHSRSLVSYSFHQHGVTIRRVRFGRVQNKSRGYLWIY